MSDMKVRYRRVSVVREDGSKVKYDARVDTEADPVSGVVVHKVYSQVVDRFVPYRCTGNAAEDAIGLEVVCQKVYEFDQNFRVRSVPKPPRTGSSYSAAVMTKCGRCGDQGWYEDDYGYQITCECRS